MKLSMNMSGCTLVTFEEVDSCKELPPPRTALAGRLLLPRTDLELRHTDLLGPSRTDHHTDPVH